MPPEEKKKLKKQQDEQQKKNQSEQQNESQHGGSSDPLLKQIEEIGPVFGGNQNMIDALSPEDDVFSLFGKEIDDERDDDKRDDDKRKASAIRYEQVSGKVRKELIGNKAGEIKALFVGKSPEEGIEAIRSKYRLTAEEMDDPEAVPRMMEPYFRTALSDLSKDKDLTAEQQKALSDFSEEMDQQMMINAMKAPGKEQKQNIEEALRNGEESKQVSRELKAHRIGKLLFGEEGFKSNFRSMFRSPKKPDREEVDQKTKEEQSRQKESARSLLKIFLMLQIGNMQMRKTDEETGNVTDTDWEYSMSDLFAHGGRIVIETGDQSGDPEKKDSVGDLMASVFSKDSAFHKRSAATHYIGEGDMGEFKEDQGKGAALKGSRDKAWENYGMPVAIGGSGNKGPRMFDEKSGEGNRIIKNDNRNGHLYVGKKEGSVKQHGGFLIGLESDGPYRMNQWGHVHTMWATPERIKSTGGMKSDLHGDKVSGRNLDLGGMKNEDLVRLMQDVDTGFDELYGSEDDGKQKEYNGILRKITGKRLEAEEVEEILKKLTKRDDLGISVEKIRKESRGQRPILPKELMEELGEKTELTEEEEERKKARAEMLEKLAPEGPGGRQRFEVKESSEEEPAGPRPDDMVARFLAAQGKTLQDVQAAAEERARKREEKKKIHGDPYADVPLDVGPLFYEDDKSPEAKKEYEEANRLAAEKMKKAKGGDQVYDPEEVGQEWLYDRDENGRYYSAQASSDPTHFGKRHKLDTSAYLILADQVIRVDDYIAGRTTADEEKAVKETKPEPMEKVPEETALVPADAKFTAFSETMQKNCMDGIENLREFMEQYAPQEEKEAYQKLFKSIELYERALSTGQVVEPELFFRSIPSESITFKGSYDLRKLRETGITSDQLQAVQKFLEITDIANPAVLRLSDGIAAVQRALAGTAGGLKRLSAPEEEQEKKQEKTGGVKLISDNPFSRETEVKKEASEPPKEEQDFSFDFDFNIENPDAEVPKPEGLKPEKKEVPKQKKSTSMFDLFKLRNSKGKEKLPEGKDIGPDIDLEKQITGASCYAYVAASLLRHFGKKYGIEEAQSVKETDFPKAYGYGREKKGTRQRGRDGEDLYEVYRLNNLPEKGLREEFPNVGAKVGYGSAQDMNDIVESIHQMSGGKAALNSKVYQKSEAKTRLERDTADEENMADLKKTVMHVVDDRKMPVGLFYTTGDTGHYILVVGADEEGYFYKDSMHNHDKVEKANWSDLRNYSQVSIKFLQHTDEISKDRKDLYRPMTGEGNEAEIERTLMFPNDTGKHFEHVDAYAYDDGTYSYQSIQPKKKKK